MPEVPVTKSNILRNDWKKFEISKFISDFNQKNWEQILCNEENDVNFSMNKYLSKIDILLDTHGPFKKLNRKELKFLTKSWITQGLQSSIISKNKIYSKFMKCKNKIMKEFHHNNYKNCRNLLSTLLERAKEKYFTNFFMQNIKDVKNTWKGIKTLVSMKQKKETKNNDRPLLITKDEKYINDPVSVADTFNNFLINCSLKNQTFK